MPKIIEQNMVVLKIFIGLAFLTTLLLSCEPQLAAATDKTPPGSFYKVDVEGTTCILWFWNNREGDISCYP